jgi:hypothetical protein
MQAVASELDHAYGKHGRDQWGRHEFYAILKEEVDELWNSIKADEPQERVRTEAIQVAAMVFRWLETGDRYRDPSNAKPPLCSVVLLADIIAGYLASDGSFGLYEAGWMCKHRDRLVSEIGMNRIKGIQRIIRESLSANMEMTGRGAPYD